jgi:uncharacterized repeat protein (TIGR01451 family)
VTLTDSATLSGGNDPTGTITFELFHDGIMVHTETVAVNNGNNTYVTLTGFTLPTSGTVVGTYTWMAHYSGDANNSAADDQGTTAEETVVSKAIPTLVTMTDPATITLGPTTPPILTDSATLEGYFPTGNLVFDLFYNGTMVHTETVAVDQGNGTYTTPTGFTLPTTGTVSGTYTWTVSYEGDGNNEPTKDQGTIAEQTVVSKASLTLVTIASPPTVTLGTTAPILSDSAVLSGGFNPTGKIVFTLTGPGGFSKTQTDPVSGNKTYTASIPLPTTGMVVGTYTWTVAYQGDGNNKPVTETGDETNNEQTVVRPASPTLVTTASPDIRRGALPPTLTDSAVLSGGYFPMGTITFTLTGPGGFSFIKDVTVNGNNTYTASTTLPTKAVTGVYTWTAHYSDDANNNATDDQGGPAEQVTVAPESPTLLTTASPDITLSTTAPTLTDSADLTGGFNPTGTIVFTLTGPGGFSFTEDATVDGNGTYTASTTLPATGTVAGLYTWTAHYGGDVNNNEAIDQGGPTEQTVVSPASPALVTTASPSTAMLGTTLQDLADLTGGFDPTGSIVFRLYAPGVDPTVGPAAYTEIVTGVNGNGTYHTIVGFVANATGIWHWVATYNGDSNNNSVSSGPLDEPVTVPQQADVMLTKLVNPTTAIFGTPVTYTLIAHNNGPDAASGVVVTDTLPAGLMFLTATPSQGSFNPGSGQWIIGTLANGATATLQITGLVATIGPISNTASVTASQFDPDLANNSSSATIEGMFAAGQISKRLLLSSSDAPLNPATLAAEEALFNAVMPRWVNLWDALLSEAQSLLAARTDPGPGNGGVPVFEGNWFGSPLVVYANPFAGQVTAVQVGAFDFLYENSVVAGVRMSP